MDTKTLVRIINRELSSVQEIAKSFQTEETIHELEINLMLSKIKEVYNLLAMLKPENEVEQLKEVSLNKITDEHLKEVESTDHWREEKEEEKEMGSDCTVLQKEAIMPQTPIVEAAKQKEQEEKQQSIINEDTIVFEQKQIDETVDFQDDAVMEQKKEEEENLLKSREEQIEEKSQTSNILADRFQDKKISLNDTLAGFKNDKDIAALLTARPIDNLKTAVKINDRIWYIQELFDNNADLYTQTIDAVNNLDNLDTALSYLFSKFDWDQNRKSTISFLELIYRRFTKI